MMKKILSSILCLCLMLPIFGRNDTISAAAQEVAVFTEDGLTLNKTAVMNGDGETAEVTLEAYTTGKVTTVESAVPMDIVLVLDQSGSMTYDFGNTTRQAALKTAVTSFIDSVSSNAKKSMVNHRIGIVTYASQENQLIGLTDVSTDTNRAMVKGKVNGLSNNPQGSTRVDLGMNEAAKILNNDTLNNDKRNRMVIVFTDGVPIKSSAFNTEVADSAINTSNTLKSKAIDVYTIGIFDAADKTQLHGKEYRTLLSTTACDGSVGSQWGYSTMYGWFSGDIEGYDVAAGNRFLNYLSSNFIAPQRIGISKDGNFGGLLGGDGWYIEYNAVRNYDSYYMTASNTAGLESIFKTISDTIGTPTISLGANAVIKDVVSDYFNMPGNVSDIKLYESAYNGVSFEPRTSSNATVKIEGNSLSVTGFDFDKNFVTTTKKADNSFGKKLIIEFTISVKDGFFGGADVPTNNPASGVYDDNGSLVKAFPQPEVDVPLRYEIGNKEDYHIYCTDSVDLKELVAFMESSVPNESFKPDGWNNDFVTITYIIKDSSGTPVATYSIAAGETTGQWNWPDGGDTISPMENTSYMVECAVTSGVNDRMKKDGLKSKTNIYVYLPHITWQDSYIYLGEAANYSNNLAGVVWKTNGQTEDWSYSPEGNSPGPSYTYSPEAGFLQQDTDVDVKVFIGDLDITQYATFINGTSHNGQDNAEEFAVHVKTCSMTLSKSGWDSIDENQSFIFNVKGSGNLIAESINMNVVVQGNGSVTITGLPIGTYTIKEDENWSWRYKTDNSPYIVNLTPDCPDNTGTNGRGLVINNTRTRNKWLDGNAYCSNVFRHHINTNK